MYTGERVGQPAHCSQELPHKSPEPSLPPSAPREGRRHVLQRLSRNVAFELNNLLTVIGASVEQLLASQPADQQLEALLDIERAAQGSAQLAAQLMALARRGGLDVLVVDLPGQVHGTLEELRAGLPESIEVRSRIDPDAGAVMVEPVEFQRALDTLLQNAVEAMGDHGVLSVDVEAVGLHGLLAEGALASRQPFVMVAVSDTGVGISARDRLRMFDLGFSTKPGHQGMGLSWTREFVRGLGGVMRVDSSRGEGSTVSIYLPAVTSAEPSEPAPSRKGRQRQPTILLVDDEAPVRRALRRLLGSDGYLVLEAASAEQALVMLADDEQQQVALVLSDVLMPGMNGVELMQVVAERHPWCCRLLISGFAADALPATSRLPHVPLLQKPATKAELLDAVNQVLEAARPARFVSEPSY